MAILITGANGFIGSALVNSFKDQYPIRACFRNVGVIKDDGKIPMNVLSKILTKNKRQENPLEYESAKMTESTGKHEIIAEVPEDFISKVRSLVPLNTNHIQRQYQNMFL